MLNKEKPLSREDRVLLPHWTVIFVSMELTGFLLSANCRIGKQFPKSQHKVIVIDLVINLSRINKPEIQR